MIKLDTAKLFSIGVFASIALTVNAQEQVHDFGTGFNCSQHIENNRLLATDPNYAQEQAVYENYLQKKAAELKNDNKKSGAAPKYVIPVVFHIIHKNGQENISYEQVQDAIATMNEEYNGKNAALAGLDPLFKPVAGIAEIEFRLATKDPNGNCTNGVERFYDENTSTAGENVKTNRQWPTNKYLNVYTCERIESGAAGYAYFPANNSGARDGILIIHSYVGRTGTGTQGRSSALTHEAGHYLALNHTWGPGNNVGLATNCNQDDNVSDTPNCTGVSVCNLNVNTCGAGTTGDQKDNVQNFMDYAYCYANYTQGQVARMHAALESGTGGRNNLWKEANLIATGTNSTEPLTTLCKAEFSVVGDRVEICPGSSVSFNDMSYFAPSSWEWSFEGATPATSNVKNPSVTYNTPGVYSVTLKVLNDNGELSTTKEQLITVLDNQIIKAPYAQDFENINESLSPDFSVNNPNGDRTFQLFIDGGFNSGSSILLANRAITVEGRTDELISNVLDLSGMTDPIITFKYAYARRNSSSSDEMRVLVSGDCGALYSTKSLFRATSTLPTAPDQSAGDFVPSNDTQWKEGSVKIGNQKSTTSRFKFVWKSGGGNNFFIDNINVVDAAVGIKEIAGLNNLSLYPNPSNESSELNFQLDKSKTIEIGLYDLLGKKVKTITNTNLNAGTHQVKISRGDLQAGIYLVRISVDKEQRTLKLVFN